MKTLYDDLYIVSAEVVAKPGSEMWGHAKGGYLYCIVPEKDAEKAADAILAHIEANRKKLGI